MCPRTEISAKETVAIQHAMQISIIPQKCHLIFHRDQKI